MSILFRLRLRVLRALGSGDGGAMSADYGMSIALLVTIVAGAATALGTHFSGVFSSVGL